MPSEPLPQADRDYAAAWCLARGKRPHYSDLNPPKRRWIWHRLSNNYDHCRLPTALMRIIGQDGAVAYFHTESAAMTALALALRECRAAAGLEHEPKGG